MPRWQGGVVVADAPGAAEAGHWAGAPSAYLDDDGVYLAYRLRRPVAQGRGTTIVVARSLDGEHFEPLARIERAAMAADSLERPALTRTPDGTWRLYLSCATPGSAHWRVDLLEASDPSEFDPSRRRTVLPGDATTGVKDPVIVRSNGRWHLWASCHPLGVPEETDRMVTRYATSQDGISWTWHGTALTGRPGAWDARGTRVTAAWFDRDGGADVVRVAYDGRATAAENYEERTGFAAGTEPSALSAYQMVPAATSPHGTGCLRYLCVLALPGGGYRLYYEAAGAGGGHELRTELVPTRQPAVAAATGPAGPAGPAGTASVRNPARTASSTQPAVAGDPG